MKKILLIIIIETLVCSCSVTKTEHNEMRYLDENNVEISKLKFNQIRSNNNSLVWAYIKEGSLLYKKLTPRKERGKITNRPFLESLLEQTTNRELDSNKPIVIIYYPGKDPCNSSGTATRHSIKKWHKQLKEGINQIVRVKPIYIYKDNDGLEKSEKILDWHKDPKGTIERLFFKHHYPCSSFVVISKNGSYLSYFGEVLKENVWKATQLMNEPVAHYPNEVSL